MSHVTEIRATPHPWVAQFQDRIGFGLQIGARQGDPGPGRSLVRAAQVGDRLGFDAFFLGDHPAWSPEIWTHFGAIAATTERIRFGPMVAANPYRPPLLTARILSDLDHLSNGRAINGLGIGWNAADYDLGVNEFDRMGLPYPSTRERQEALEEAIELIRGLWSHDRFDFDGRYYRAAGASIPAPVQQSGPPLVLAGGGERVTLRQVARLADACNFGPGPAGGCESPSDAARKHAALRRHCEEVGRPFKAVLRTHFTHWVMVARDRTSLEAKRARYFPAGPDSFWAAKLVAETVEGAIAYFQSYADAGTQYFVAQVLDPYDDETFELLIQEVAPHIQTRPFVAA
jgi:alkanesulfonate monooxygenase SsuD/methylene tetrahydromethanopterin reductase-like flavin-dependent oxidoreductase (luciferase family)